MSKFKYEIFQRVMVPGDKETQGVIVSQSASLEHEPKYGITWLKVTRVDGRTDTIPTANVFPESAIAAAQPPAMISQFDADARVSVARSEERAKLGRDIFDLNAKIERLEAAAKRRQKAKRTARTRRRR